MASKAQGPVIGDGSLHVGDRVVYPNQGICKITGVEVKQIAGQQWEVVTLSREEDGATVMVPKAKVMGIGLRKVAQADEVDKIFDLLAAPWEDPQLDWKIRHRENADKMSGGGLMGTVEVLKGLHALARVRPLPAKERELYDNARHMLIREIAAAVNLPNHVAEDNLDYALWPPEGMKRKGRLLPPATLGPPPAAPLRPVAADDEGDDEALGFEEEAAPVAGATPAAAADDGEEETAAAPAKPAAAPAAKKPAATRPPPPASRPPPVPKPVTLAPKTAPAAAKAAAPKPPAKAAPKAVAKPVAKKPPPAPARKAVAKKPAAKKPPAKAAPKPKKPSKPASKGKKK